MTILETITDGLCSAKNALVDVAQDVVEKSHQKAQLNRLRSIMKKENKTMEQAFTALGKAFYENMTEEDKKEHHLICQVIETSSERLERAHRRYIEIADGIADQSPENKEEITSEELDSLTVACSNENEYKEMKTPVKVTVKEIKREDTHEKTAEAVRAENRKKMINQAISHNQPSTDAENEIAEEDSF